MKIELVFVRLGVPLMITNSLFLGITLTELTKRQPNPFVIVKVNDEEIERLPARKSTEVPTWDINRQLCATPFLRKVYSLLILVVATCNRSLPGSIFKYFTNLKCH
jgi:hypothetical protein